MNRDDENIEVQDHFERAKQMLADLTKDGYPDFAQMTIVSMAMCKLLGDSENEENLREGVEMTQRIIDDGSKLAFQRRAR
jgi:hypothetical protein